MKNLHQNSIIKNVKSFLSEEMFGATITRLLDAEQLPSVGFDRVIIRWGSSLEPHVHKDSESFLYVLKGSAIVILDSNCFQVKIGDTIYIPAGVSHGFSTPDEDVELLSIQSPPIYPDGSVPDIQFANHTNRASA